MGGAGRLLLLLVTLQLLLNPCSGFNSAAGKAVPKARAIAKLPLRTPKAPKATPAKPKPVPKQSAKRSVLQPKAAAEVKAKAEPTTLLPPPPPRQLSESAVVKAIVQKRFELTLDDVVAITEGDRQQAEAQMVSLAVRTNAQIHKGKAGRIVFTFPSNFRRALAAQRLKNAGKLALQPIVSVCKAIGNVTAPVARAAWLAAKLTLSALLLPTPSGLAEQPMDLKQKWEQDVARVREYAKLHSNLSLDELETWESAVEQNLRAFPHAAFYDPVKRKYYDPLKGRLYSSPPVLGYQRFYGERLVPQPSGDVDAESMLARVSNAELGLLEAVMSYLFGDGQPTDGTFSQAQLHAVAKVIEEHGGIVAAEQLAPYLNPPRLADYLAGSADARFMLPILQQFGGKPVLSKGGDLLYQFPNVSASLGTVAVPRSIQQFGVASREQLRAISQGDVLAALQRAGIYVTDDAILDTNAVFEKLVQLFQDQITQQGGAPVPASLYEQPVLFSAAPVRQQRRIARWGAASLVASVMAGIDLARRVILKRAGRMDQLMKAAVPAMILSSLAFNLLPAVRFRLVEKINAGISDRNKVREEWAEYLAQPDAALKKKLSSARQMATKSRHKPTKEAEVRVRADLTPVPKDLSIGRLKHPRTKSNFPL